MNKKSGIIVGVFVIAVVLASLFIMASQDTTTNEVSEVATDSALTEESNVDVVDPVEVEPRSDFPDSAPENTTPLETVNSGDKVDTSTETSPAPTAAEPIISTVSDTVSYSLPRAHTGTLELTATVEDGVIASLDINHLDVTPQSQEHHDIFDNQNLELELVGVSLDEVEDVQIAGASLTSAAFNEAIANLASQV